MVSSWQKMCFHVSPCARYVLGAGAHPPLCENKTSALRWCLRPSRQPQPSRSPHGALVPLPLSRVSAAVRNCKLGTPRRAAFSNSRGCSTPASTVAPRSLSGALGSRSGLWGQRVWLVPSGAGWGGHTGNQAGWGPDSSSPWTHVVTHLGKVPLLLR